jgi:hypothetical protein
MDLPDAPDEHRRGERTVIYPAMIHNAATGEGRPALEQDPLWRSTAGQTAALDAIVTERTPSLSAVAQAHPAGSDFTVPRAGE